MTVWDSLRRIVKGRTLLVLGPLPQEGRTMARGHNTQVAAIRLSAVVACVLIVTATLQPWRTKSMIMLKQGDATDPLPSISSACVEGKKECLIAVKGGSLRLSVIKFPDGLDKPGSATASGYVNGNFVSGEVELSMAKADRDDYWAGKREEESEASTGDKGAADKGLQRPVLKQKSGGGKSSTMSLNDKKSSVASTQQQQYELALKAVEDHIKAREEKVEAEAKKIAEAVTRVITSPAVTAKVANLAMAAAAIKQRQIGGQTGAGGIGTNQFGYAVQPAGASLSVRQNSVLALVGPTTAVTTVTKPLQGMVRTSSVQQAAPFTQARGVPVAMGPAWTGVRVPGPNDPWIAFRQFQMATGVGS